MLVTETELLYSIGFYCVNKPINPPLATLLFYYLSTLSNHLSTLYVHSAAPSPPSAFLNFVTNAFRGVICRWTMSFRAHRESSAT